MKDYKCICIVDDEEIFATIQMDKLREEGRTVHYFNSIQSFMNDIEVNSIHRFDLILLDRYFIPEDYDSLEDGLANQLKSKKFYGFNGDILLWTNGAMESETPLKQGFDAIFPKSFLLSDKLGR